MKWLRRILIGLGVLVLILVLVSVWMIRRPWPKVKGTETVAGLSAPVRIVRDEWGVPYIYADNETDLLFAQGYVHAQDRLWQMEFTRRIGNGTLSEILGELTLDIDKFMRTVGLRRVAAQDWEVLDAESRTLLEAYAAGVNAYMENNALPIEYTILSAEVVPWEPLDTLTIGKLMGWQLSGDYGLDMLRAQTVAKLGADQAVDIFAFAPEGVVVPSEVNNYQELELAQTLAPFSTLLNRPNLFAGSNSWVVSGEHTATGLPLLADDTHLGLGMPSIWYMNGLQGGQFNSIGFTLAGVPLVIAGHNHQIAWGPTNLSTDLQELFIERLDDPENPTQYEYMGEWRDLEIIEEIIIVNGSDPITLAVWKTHHGPIINEVEGWSELQPVALQWTDLEGSRLFHALVQMNLATDWDEFRDALSYWDAPKENFVYADVAGNIGLQSVGRVPLRVPGSTGVLPVPGWTGTYEWQGYIPFEEMPFLFNPPEGYIVAANSRSIPPDNSPHLIEYYGIATFRPDKIAAVLTNSDDLTLADFQALQGDIEALSAEMILPYLLSIEPENEAQEWVLQELQDWNLQYETDSVGASLYESWQWLVQINTLGDELGEDMLFIYQLYSLAGAPQFIDLLADPNNVLFDDITTETVETRDDILRRSLEDSLAWLEENHGEDREQWQWGQLHSMTFVHSPLGQTGIPLIDGLFNSSPIPAVGSDFTVNNAWYSANNRFAMEGGASQRLLVDLSNWENTLGILTTGQSEHLFHRHREDMIPLWQNLEYIVMPSTEERENLDTNTVLVLEPQ